MSLRLPRRDAREALNRSYLPWGGRPPGPRDLRPNRARRCAARDAFHERDRAVRRPDPEDPRPDDAWDERGHARLWPWLRVLRGHPAAHAVLPLELHRRGNRNPRTVCTAFDTCP